jgi:hypothetical protein
VSFALSAVAGLGVLFEAHHEARQRDELALFHQTTDGRALFGDCDELRDDRVTARVRGISLADRASCGCSARGTRMKHREALRAASIGAGLAQLAPHPALRATLTPRSQGEGFFSSCGGDGR